MNNLHPIAQAVQSQGRGKDTQLVHMTPNEVAGMQALAKAHGGSLSINPSTGLPEAGILDSMLPTILGVGLAAATGGTSLALTPGMIGLGIGGLQYMRTGSLEKGLMAGLGAYGGAGMAGSLGLGASGAAGGVGSGATVQAPTIDPNAAANIGAQTSIPANYAVSGGTNAGSLGLDASAKGINLAGMTPPAPAVGPYAFTPPPTATTMPVTGVPTSNVQANQFALSNQPTMMDKLGSGQFWKDNWTSAAAAAAPTVMDMMAPEGGPGYKPDNERFDYTYDPGRVSQEDLDAQRAAYAARGITGGELKYFNPTYAGPNKTYAAKGGLLSLAEGGMPNDYEYDPVSQTYKKVAQAPTAAVAPVGISNTGDSSPPVKLTQQQIDFFDNEDKSPGGARDQRMGKINDFISLVAPLGFARSMLSNMGPSPAAPNPGGYTPTPPGQYSGGPNSFDGSGPGDAPGGAADAVAGGGYDPDFGYGMGFAKGGIAGLAAGGMSQGGFVVPADVVSALGNGSSDAGLRKLYALIGDVKPIKGKGDGLSDSIPTNIDGRQPARVADGEAYVNPKTVAKIGGGDAKKGAKKLYAMMDKIRQQAHGLKTQQREVNAKAVV
jgi:hypothetical protein